MGITFILQTDDYMGAGNQLIAKAIETGRARPLDFVWKIILTAITMRAGLEGRNRSCILRGSNLRMCHGTIAGISTGGCSGSGNGGIVLWCN